jgi:protein-tyrosine phosphatase
MIDLNQSALKAIDLTLIPITEGWKILWQCASTDINKYSIGCEQVSGQYFSDPIPLSIFAEAGEQSIELTYAMLQLATGFPVDAYSHPVICFVDNDAEVEQHLRVAPRLLPMSVTANFRDYGGQLTTEGRQVVWGKLFRTGHMGEMSNADKQALQQLNIQAICDFRRAEEMKRQPSQLPEGLEPTSISISPGSATDLFSALNNEYVNDDHIDEDIIDDFMRDINRDLVISHQSSYRKMFDTIIAHANSGSIIHCSAGKDRTGFGGLLMLAALGVRSECIMADYLRTNEYVDVAKEVERWAVSYYSQSHNAECSGADDEPKGKVKSPFNRKAIAIILRVKASYLQAAMDTIDSRYGGVDRYLRDEIGLTEGELDLLRECYLYS